ncbi:MAG: hypothetical protein AABX02_03395, partial [archaeon]
QATLQNPAAGTLSSLGAAGLVIQFADPVSDPILVGAITDTTALRSDLETLFGQSIDVGGLGQTQVDELTEIMGQLTRDREMISEMITDLKNPGSILLPREVERVLGIDPALQTEYEVYARRYSNALPGSLKIDIDGSEDLFRREVKGNTVRIIEISEAPEFAVGTLNETAILDSKLVKEVVVESADGDILLEISLKEYAADPSKYTEFIPDEAVILNQGFVPETTIRELQSVTLKSQEDMIESALDALRNRRGLLSGKERAAIDINIRRLHDFIMHHYNLPANASIDEVDALISAYNPNAVGSTSLIDDEVYASLNRGLKGKNASKLLQSTLKEELISKINRSAAFIEAPFRDLLESSARAPSTFERLAARGAVITSGAAAMVVGMKTIPSRVAFIEGKTEAVIAKGYGGLKFTLVAIKSGSGRLLNASVAIVTLPFTLTAKAARQFTTNLSKSREYAKLGKTHAEFLVDKAAGKFKVVSTAKTAAVPTAVSATELSSFDGAAGSTIEA